ncbi:MAG: hypothetical protein LBR97_02775 [Dysgonamonadaceae bacterium]|nr:hypothetical protein [Dysgonamonadaceae bacterium]
MTENGYYEDGIHYFYVKNHLGSNVMTVNRSGNIVQKNHYYPFGLTMGSSDNYYLLYAHLKDDATIVKAGQIIGDGNQISEVGNTKYNSINN